MNDDGTQNDGLTNVGMAGHDVRNTGMGRPPATDAPVPLTLAGGSRPAGGPSRREAMQWVIAAMAAASLPSGRVLGQPVGRTPIPQEKAAQQPDPKFPSPGYGSDPNLIKVYKPGDAWPLTFNAAQKKAATALADTIIPKDDLGPAASEVGVVEMVDEWVSAPYPKQQEDRGVILEGLAWIDAESAKRFDGKPFAALTQEQRHAICDDVCLAKKANKAFKEPAKFFARFRGLAAAAYYATPAGWKAIGYVGNVALAQFDGPPPEVLAKLGVTQTVA